MAVGTANPSTNGFTTVTSGAGAALAELAPVCDGSTLAGPEITDGPSETARNAVASEDVDGRIPEFVLMTSMAGIEWALALATIGTGNPSPDCVSLPNRDELLRCALANQGRSPAERFVSFAPGRTEVEPPLCDATSLVPPAFSRKLENNEKTWPSGLRDPDAGVVVLRLALSNWTRFVTTRRAS
jgi:hypothetical protein